MIRVALWVVLFFLGAPAVSPANAELVHAASVSHTTLRQVGHAIPNFQQVTADIFRGGRPSNADLDELKRQGIRTIINLEDVASAVRAEQKYANDLGLTFLTSPMGWMSSPSDQQVDDLLAALTDSHNFPIFLHCKHGRDRTGMMIGLYRVLIEGWTAQDAYTEMKDLGFRTYLYALDSYFKERSGY